MIIDLEQHSGRTTTAFLPYLLTYLFCCRREKAEPSIHRAIVSPKKVDVPIG